MKDLVTAIIGLIASALCLAAAFRQIYIGNLAMGFAFAILSLAIALPVQRMASEKIKRP